MRVDPAVVPGLLLLAAELCALAAVGFVIVRTALRQNDDAMALAQGLVVGPALWGLLVNFVMYAVPGRAGAAVGWAVMLALGAALAWRARRSRTRLLPQPRVAAGFAAAALALFWIALAARQQLLTPDSHIHFGLTASIRAGTFPPELPWTPGQPAFYHHGVDLLLGVLTPPFGPDMAFTMELLSAYVWTGLVLAAATALLRLGGWPAALIASPLLLTFGAWTLVFVTPPPVVQAPVPTGLPSAGLRASLLELYWPDAAGPTDWEASCAGRGCASPPNIYKPLFTLAYALAFVVLERAAAGQRGRAAVSGGGASSDAANAHARWPAAVTLAALVGFLGLTDEVVALVVLVVWAGLEAAALWAARRARAPRVRAALRAAAGPTLAALLLAAGGGVLTGAATDAAGSGLSLGWTQDPGGRGIIGSLESMPGGLGALGFGPVAVAAAALLLAWRHRPVLALAAGGGLFLLGTLLLRYDFAQHDLTRFDGHARNFAVLAFMVALSARLHTLRPRWRFAVGALVVLFIVWPTAAGPVRMLGPALAQGVQAANARPELPQVLSAPRGRSVIEPFAPPAVSAYVRDHTAGGARVLSPLPMEMSLATGRPNAAGFVGRIHLFWNRGASYLDAIEHLEPAALRRLGIDYVHAPDDWVNELPARAARWLQDPKLFDLLVREGADALYHVRPEFVQLDAAPAPTSFEALRRAVPAGATVYLPEIFDLKVMARAAASLPHARLLGYRDHRRLHLRTPFRTEPLGAQTPDYLVVLRPYLSWVAPAGDRRPVWWNDEVVVMALNDAAAPTRPPPLRDARVLVSYARVVDERIEFTATLADARAPAAWTGQDWVVTAVDDALPWNMPRKTHADGRLRHAAWFGGHIWPDAKTTTRTYEFDARASRLAVRNDRGAFDAAASAGGLQGPGVWVLGMRLQSERRPGDWRDAAYLPVLKIRVSDAGRVSFQVYEAESGAWLAP